MGIVTQHSLRNSGRIFRRHCMNSQTTEKVCVPFPYQFSAMHSSTSMEWEKLTCITISWVTFSVGLPSREVMFLLVSQTIPGPSHPTSPLETVPQSCLDPPTASTLWKKHRLRNWDAAIKSSLDVNWRHWKRVTQVD